MHICCVQHHLGAHRELKRSENMVLYPSGNLHFCWGEEWTRPTVRTGVYGGFFFFFFNFSWRLITLQHFSGFCHTLTWISHGCTCVPYPEPPSHFPPHPIPLSHPSAPAPSTLCHASNLDWQSVSYMIINMFQCYSLKSSHPHLLPLSPKVCSLHLCSFICVSHIGSSLLSF